MVHSGNTPEAFEEQRREIASLKKDLEDAKQKLIRAETLSTLGEMAAGIAHEIRNPLNLVNNFAALNAELMSELEEALGSGEDLTELLSDLRQNASVIVHHGHRADHAVGALMQLAGGSSGRHEMTDVNAFVDEFLRVAYRSRQALYEGFHCEIERHYDQSVGEMLLNRQEMGRALLNVLTNAFEAMDERAKEIGRGYEPRIAMTTRLEAGDVVIDIADNGPGIPEGIRDKIFEPFFTTRKSGSGAGLGLSVSHDVVTGGHHGKLSVESEPGRGTTVRIRLPREQKPD